MAIDAFLPFHHRTLVWNVISVIPWMVGMLTMLPDALLRRGVYVLGGIRVTALDAFLDVLAEGGSGYHFFGRSGEKVVLMRQATHATLQAA
jgi:hypothetical protein